MIKRLIFDLDNTLITWENSYCTFAVKKVCTSLHLNNYSNILNIVKKSISTYENTYEYFSVKNMVNFLNKNATNSSDCKNIQFTEDFVERLIYYFSLCVPEKADSSLINTLEYLHKKYDLVVLTNWFEDPQIQRLSKLDILKYFSHVYGTENIKNKPNKEAFQKAVGNLKPQECIMIGDSLETDIKGALDYNINAIFYNSKNICIPPNYLLQNTKCINSLSELVDFL